MIRLAIPNTYSAMVVLCCACQFGACEPTEAAELEDLRSFLSSTPNIELLVFERTRLVPQNSGSPSTEVMVAKRWHPYFVIRQVRTADSLESGEAPRLPILVGRDADGFWSFEDTVLKVFPDSGSNDLNSGVMGSVWYALTLLENTLHCGISEIVEGSVVWISNTNFAGTNVNGERIVGVVDCDSLAVPRGITYSREKSPLKFIRSFGTERVRSKLYFPQWVTNEVVTATGERRTVAVTRVSKLEIAEDPIPIHKFLSENYSDTNVLFLIAHTNNRSYAVRADKSTYRLQPAVLGGNQSGISPAKRAVIIACFIALTFIAILILYRVRDRAVERSP